MITEIREPNFHIDLPGLWVAAEHDDSVTLLYRDLGNAQTLSVLLLSVRPVYAIADRRRLLEDYLHHRPQFEKGLYPALRQSTPSIHECEDPHVGEWAAVDPDADHRLMHRVVLQGSLLADIVFEAHDPDEAAFYLRAGSTLDTVAVSEG